MSQNAISKLPKDVIAKIAAGEVIHSVKFAVKELVENAIDANASVISLTLSVQGKSAVGTKFLQISDNGDGIPRDSLPLLCARYSTSKFMLESYGRIDITNISESIAKVSTFGFRGEALASISSVSTRISVVTKVKHAASAFKAEYRDCALLESPGIKASSGNQGTIITITDLLYNYAHRSAAQSKDADTLAQTIELLQNFAFQYPHITFILKRQNSTVEYFRYTAKVLLSLEAACHLTPQELQALRSTAVQTLLFASQSVKDLAPVHYEKHQAPCLPNTPSDLVSVDGVLTTATSGLRRKRGFSLWINNRPVTNALLSKTLNNLYSCFLPNNPVFPFVHLSMHVAPESIDVNYHTQKLEVCLQNDTEIFRFLSEHIILPILQTSSSIHSFLSQPSLHRFSQPAPTHTSSPPPSTATQIAAPKTAVAKLKDDVFNGHTSPRSSTRALSSAALLTPPSALPVKRQTYDHNFVRTDKNERSIHQFFNKFNVSAQTTPIKQERVLAIEPCPADIPLDKAVPPLFKTPVSACTPTLQSASLKDCYKRIFDFLHVEDKRQIIKNSSHVGINFITNDDGIRELVWIFQHTTDLYAAQFHMITADFFHQMIMTSLFALPELPLAHAADQVLLYNLILATLQNPGLSGARSDLMSEIPIEDLCFEICKFLATHSDFLSTVFGLRIVCQRPPHDPKTENSVFLDRESIEKWWIVKAVPLLVINPTAFMNYCKAGNDPLLFLPNFNLLGISLIRIATECNWVPYNADAHEYAEEKVFLLVHDISLELGKFYAIKPESFKASVFKNSAKTEQLFWVFKHIYIPELTSAYFPSYALSKLSKSPSHYRHRATPTDSQGTTKKPEDQDYRNESHSRDLNQALLEIMRLLSPESSADHSFTKTDELMYFTNIDAAIQRLTSLPALYKVFERC